jgi:DNA-binding transcriptional ArsR family regulator
MLHFIDSKTRINVTDIYHHFKLEQSVASQHLAILRKQRYVITERDKKNIFYSVNYQRIKEIQQIIEALA